MMTRYLIFAFLLTCLPAPFVAASPRDIDPNNPPQGRFWNEWAEIYLAGAKSGYLETTWIRKGDEVHSKSSMHIRMKRAQTDIKLDVTQRIVETIEGKPLRYDSETDMSTATFVLTAVVENGKVTVTNKQFGVPQEQVFDAPEDCITQAWGAFRAGLLKGFAPGTTYKLRLYAPDLRLDDVVVATTTVGQLEDITIKGKPARGTHVSTVLELPAGQMTQDTWVDAQGIPIKSVMPAPGLGDLIVIPCDQRTALAAFVGPEFLVSTTVQIDRTIDRPNAESVTYRIKSNNPDAALDKLPCGGMQTVDAQSPVDVLVTCARQHHPIPDTSTKQADTLDGPREDYLEANMVLNIDDPELIKLAKRAGGKELPPYQLAKHLQEFVSEYISDASLDVGFATASEVCRTRKGDCSEHGVLLAALGRLHKIPTRVVAGLVYVPRFEGKTNVLGYHMWTQFYIDGVWYDFDAAVAEPQCSPTRIAFATSSLKYAGLADLSLPLISRIGTLSIEVVDVRARPER